MQSISKIETLQEESRISAEVESQLCNNCLLEKRESERIIERRSEPEFIDSVEPDQVQE